MLPKYPILCFSSLSGNIWLCAPTHCAPWPLAMRRHDDGEQRPRVSCSSRCVCLCARHAQLHSWMEFSSCSAASGYALGSIQRLGDHQSSFESQSNSFPPSFPSLATADRTAGCQESVTLFRRPGLAKLKNFGCQVTREFTAASWTRLWSGSSDSECSKLLALFGTLAPPQL